MRARLLALFLLATVTSSAFALGGTPRARADAQPTAAGRAAPASALSLPSCPIPASFRGGFETAARETALPLALLAALGETESRFRPDAVSPAGALGLLQLMPPAAAEVNVDPDRPASNVLGGARYLRRMLDRFSSTDLALAAYNAGPGAVERSGGAPSGQTLTYVATVTERWRSLVGCR
jgi:soluble lytic murein transglycosylase-like protein